MLHRFFGAVLADQAAGCFKGLGGRRPFVSAAVGAVVRALAGHEGIVQVPEGACVVWLLRTRPDTGETIARSFSVSDAKKAGLWNKQGPWQQYPKRMLQMRARAWALRDGCADMLRGFQVREEVEDYQPITARAVPTERPNLAARLAAPNDAPREGFSAVHGIDPEDNIPDFDADTPSDAASNKPASDPASDPSDAGDPFRGDLPPAEDTTASGAEADADEEKSLAVDTIAWADRLIADLPFLRPEQIEALETDRKELAKFAVLKATDMAKARELEAAIQAAKEG